MVLSALSLVALGNTKQGRKEEQRSSVLGCTKMRESPKPVEAVGLPAAGKEGNVGNSRMKGRRALIARARGGSTTGN